MGISIADKLKKYISENGGNPTGAQTIAELVDKLPAAGSGGGSLDNVFVAVLTYYFGSHDEWKIDKSFTEISDAVSKFHDAFDSVDPCKAVLIVEPVHNTVYIVHYAEPVYEYSEETNSYTEEIVGYRVAAESIAPVISGYQLQSNTKMEIYWELDNLELPNQLVNVNRLNDYKFDLTSLAL